jgi:hypothetical protein
METAPKTVPFHSCCWETIRNNKDEEKADEIKHEQRSETKRKARMENRNKSKSG